MTFPRVPGIEAAGVVAVCPGGEFAPGQQVVAMMGGMGRTFDGGVRRRRRRDSARSRIERIRDAHSVMEGDRATGKIVVLPRPLRWRPRPARR